VFIWLFLLDSVIAVSTTLIGQWVTVGFDPIFANPILIAALALIFMLIESYLPFVILYGLVFPIVIGKTKKIRHSTLCWVFLVPLLLISLSVEILSFGRCLDLLGLLVPVGLAILNVAFFFQRRIRATRPPATPQ
jgi:hypothetical protein